LYGWKVEDRGPAHLTKSQLWGDGCPEGASIAAQLVKHSRGEAASKREAASSVLKQVEVQRCGSEVMATPSLTIPV